jgi:hypothetical protein
MMLFLAQLNGLAVGIIGGRVEPNNAITAAYLLFLRHTK